LDRAGHLTPLGSAGHLHVGGAGLARGYLDRPELTAERFVPDPTGAEPGARLYRTGDLARFLGDGRLDYLGRIDHQVKLRGYRIELGEIEAVMRQCPGVHEAAVVLLEGRGGGEDRRLAAVYTAGEGGAPSSGELRHFLARRLPAYMVPSQFEVLAALPLTPSGKVDRRALPALLAAGGAAEGERHEEHMPPRGPVEEMLAGIWEEILGRERVGAEDNFFALGGHSLLATQLVSRMRAAFGVELPLRVVFEHPTVAGLAQEVEQASRLGGDTPPPPPPLIRIDRGTDLPLSFAQQRLWFIDQLEGGSLYNVPVALRMSGELSVRVLSRVFAEVVRRHEVLRTVFRGDGGQARQVILPPGDFALPLVDLTGLSPALREPAAMGLAMEEARRPFDLAREPLLRVGLWRLGETEHLMLVAMHHIVSDGWSLGVLVREVTALYTAFSLGLPSPLAELPVQYTDFAAWQRSWLAGDVLEGELQYWRDRLSGAPPVLELPTDRPRPAVQSFRGAVRPLSLSPGLSAALASLSRREGATLFMTLVSALGVLLSRFSGQADLTLGTPVAGRHRLEIESLIGFFVNTLVLRPDLSAAPRFTELVSRVRREALAAYAHQDLPFEKLVEDLAPERSLSHTPLYQVMFAWQNAAVGELALPGLRLVPRELLEEVAKFDLSLSLHEAGDRIAGSLSYVRDLFDAPTVDRLAVAFSVLLTSAVENPELPVSQLSLLGPGERHQLVAEWNATSTHWPSGSTLPELFALQAAAHPRRLAWVLGGEELSYGELAVRSDAVARFLRRQALGAGDLVGLCVERSGALLVAMLGILKAGAAYLPLDPDYPRDRLSWMLEDSGAPLLLTQESLALRLPPSRARMVRLDSQWEEIAGAGDEPVAVPGTSSADLAYVIYTSGSTGRPKGVAVPHRAVVRLVLATDYIDFGDLGGPQRVAQLSSISFDAAAFEVWGALLSGATLVGVPRETILSPADLAAFLGAARIDVVLLITALFNQVAQQAPEIFAVLRTVLFGGEAADPGAVRRALASGGPERLLHVYGPSENATLSTWYRVEAVAANAVTVPIGRPIANTRVYLLDAGLQPVPLGGVGELYLAGEGLALGYWRQPERTGERFVESQALPGERLYRTGDLARFLPDGNLEFRGRHDQQIKLRGFRIELGEIELALTAVEGVAEAAVVLRDDLAGGRGLVAYLVCGAGAEPSPAALRQALRDQLPDYMVPAHFVPIAALPLTPSGKVDRKWLVERGPFSSRPSGTGLLAGGGSRVAPRTPAEELLAGIFAAVLGIENVGAEADFFALGGHSLLATQLVSQLRATFEVELPLRVLFERPTVAELAHAVEELRRSETSAAHPPLVPVPRDGADLPLSFAQQRLWFIDQLEGGSLYNVPVALRAGGELSIAVLSQVFEEIVRRHEVLRTVFRGEGSRVRQVILPPGGFSVPLVDLSGVAVPERDAAVASGLTGEAERPFDLERGPLLRVRVWRLAAEEHLVLVVLHHIAGDGWSMGVLVREMAALYQAFSLGEASPLAELPVQYADFAVWQRSWLSGEVLARELAYWREHLAGAPPVLELPADRPRPLVQSLRGRTRPVVFDLELSETLAELARRHRATLFMVLTAAFQSLLARTSGVPELCLGTPIAGRTRRETEDLIGFFVNTLVLRGDLSGDPSFADHLAAVRWEALAAYAHQDLPFEKLVSELAPERSLAHTPLFQVMIALQNAPSGPLDLPGVRLEPLSLESSVARFDLTLSLTETALGLSGFVEYDIALFDPSTIERLVGQLETLLRSASSRALSAEQRISELALLSAAERQQLLWEWRGVEGEAPALSVPARLALQALRTPSAVALEWGDARLTHGELARRAGSVARRLRAAGVGTETRVGLLVERSLDLVVGLLGIWRAGGAAVPLDPGQPASRLHLLLEDALPAGASAVVSQRGLLELHESLRLGSMPVVWVDDEGETGLEVPPAAPAAADLAYLLYTSGSTGQPKAVLVEHGSLAHTLAAAQEVFDLAAGERMPVLAPATFDAFLLELLMPLLGGGTAVLIENRPVLDMALLLAELERSTLLFAVPSVMRRLTTAVLERGSRLPRLRRAFTGAEAVERDLVTSMRQAFAGARIAVLYGPTEAAIFATWEEPDEASNNGIGRPLPGVALEVRDAAGSVVPAGSAGELWLGGPGVARGYLGRPELTAERFVPSSSGRGERLYRTGDRVRFHATGRQ
ncbi:MAG TPA: amino acid adenylation domain-containing protein, partial [Thermoanaerobaculia bacterium]|nr:amino acid adenylation domain-containing protein [Thermoanaerobaculia bacterium]